LPSSTRCSTLNLRFFFFSRALFPPFFFALIILISLPIISRFLCAIFPGQAAGDLPVRHREEARALLFFFDPPSPQKLELSLARSSREECRVTPQSFHFSSFSAYRNTSFSAVILFPNGRGLVPPLKLSSLSAHLRPIEPPAKVFRSLFSSPGRSVLLSIHPF